MKTCTEAYRDRREWDVDGVLVELPTAAAAAGLDLGHLCARLVDRAIARRFT